MENKKINKKIELSILIPTYKEQDFIGPLLESIYKQETTLKFEVIVINRSTGDDDKTSEVVNSFKKTKFYEIEAKKDSRNKQRNLGIDEAKADWVLMLDGDMIMEGNLLNSIQDSITKAGDTVGFVVTEHGIGDSYWAKVKAHEKNLLIGNRYSEVARLYNKKTLQSIGGYPGDIIGGEDKYIELKMSEKGAIGRVNQSYLIHSEGSVSLKDLIKVKAYYANTIPALRTGKAQANSWSVNDLLQLIIDAILRFLAPFHPRSWKKMFLSPLKTVSLFFLRCLEWGASIWPMITRVKKSEKKSKLLLLGAYGQKNLGDDLLLQSFIEKYYKDFSVIAKVDDATYLEETLNKYEVKYANFYGIKGSLNLLNQIVRSKVVIFGGGTLLFKCNSGFIRDRLYLKLYAISLLARLTRSKVIIAHGGINKEDSKLIKFLLKRIYKITNKIVLRDDVSRVALLEAIESDKKNKVFVATDIVWSFDGLLEEDRKKSSKRKVIAISLLGNHNLKKREQVLPGILSNTAESLKRISDNVEEGVKFVFIPYLNDGSEIDDHAILNSLIKQLDKSITYEVYIPHQEKGYPTNVIEKINNCDIMIASRLHSIITCVLGDVLPIELSYSSKCDAQMNQLYLDDECLDIYNFESSDLAETVIKYIKNDRLRQEKLNMVRTQRKYFKKINDDALRAVSKELK
jgi:polysaccharide pyruvyl transferase WcaK-like protein